MKRVPQELQSEQSECGLASLAMVTGTYAQQLNLGALRQLFPDRGMGVSLKDLADYAQQLGFAARGLKVELRQLQRLTTPAILHWEMNHFVVLVAVRRGGLLVHDPARGRTLCGWSEANTSFTGVALEVFPTRDFDPRATASTSRTLQLRDMWQLVRGSTRNLTWVFVLSVLLQLLMIAGPWHMQWTVDQAVLPGDQQLVLVLATGFSLLLLLRAAIHWLRSIVVVHLGFNLAYLFAARLLGHLLSLPLGWFERRRVGDIQSRFASLGPVQDFFTQGAAALLVDGIIVLFSLLVMLLYSPLLACIVVGVQAVFVTWYLALVPRLKAQQMSIIVSEAAEQSHILEAVKAIHSVKVYTQEAQRLHTWQALHGRTIEHGLSHARLNIHIGTLALVVGGVENVAVVALGAQMVIAGDGFSLGMLFAFVSYRGFFSERLLAVTQQLVELKSLQVHMQRLADIWLAEPETVAGTSVNSASQAPANVASAAIPTVQTLALPAATLALTLDRVRFSYGGTGSDATEWVLDDVRLQVKPGEFVAIVGASGAGKSTLLRLLMGLSPPTAGKVLLGTHQLGPPLLKSYRAQLGCVLQEDGFFSGSLAENIALFETVQEPRLLAVLEQVGLVQTVLQLPMSYHTQIGDIGNHFSSGQMQRLMLARALYRQPRYLFLDEGTAHLDTASAQVLHGLIYDLVCTRVVVTHDLNFARRADRVLELRDGRLSEFQ